MPSSFKRRDGVATSACASTMAPSSSTASPHASAVTEASRLSDVASLLGEPARARIVSALMGGTALPATDLALLAGVRPSTASEHLARLVTGGLLAVERHGRH